MGKGLIISDHPLLSEIYALNLKFYTDSRVIIRKGLVEGLKHLKEPGVRLDFIILVQTEDDKKSLIDFHNFLKDNKIHSSLIVSGPAEPLAGNIVFIPSAFDIKGVVRTVARLMDVTAKKMIEVVVPDYISFSMKHLENLAKTPVPVYLKSKTAEEYVQKWNAEQLIKPDELMSLTNQNCDEVYVLAKHRLRFLNALSASLLVHVSRSEKLSPSESLGLAERGMELVASQIMSTNSVSEVKELAEICVGQMEKTIKELTNIEKLLKMLISSNSSYAFMHSVMTAYISKKVIENISWGSKEQAEKVSFVLFYHDLYLVPFYNEHPQCFGEKDLLLNSSLSDADKDVVLKHASMAGELLREMKQIPMGAEAIVVQHHGTTSGIGFPVECKDDISPLAKVILIAEDYVNYFLKHMNSLDGDRNASPEAFFAEVHQRYPKPTYKKIINTLQNLSL